MNLKPCPFCGDKAQIAQTFDDDWWVSCNNDECKGNVGYFYTRDQALHAWGMRQSEAKSTQDAQS